MVEIFTIFSQGDGDEATEVLFFVLSGISTVSAPQASISAESMTGKSCHLACCLAATTTRTSFHLNVVFVELEDPAKKIFAPKGVHLPLSAEFTKAEAQIKSWRDYVSENRESLLKRIATLIPFSWLRMAKVEFRYVIIFGRESEFQNREDRRKRFRELNLFALYQQDRRIHRLVGMMLGMLR